MIEFKNLRLYRWDGPEGRTYWNELFLRRPFLPVGPQNETSEGWAPPFGDDEAIADVGGHWLAHWVREERILPASVVKAEAEQRAEAIAEERGYPLSRKELRDLRETIRAEWLPRAFTRRRRVPVWIDPREGWFAVDAGSLALAERVIDTLRASAERFPLKPWRTRLAPASAMADWLLAGEAPGPFSLEDEVQLEAQDDSRALVRYARLPLQEEKVAAEIRAHLGAGKRPTRLALAYADRLSFVLTADGALKRLARSDAEDETAGEARDARERFEGRFYLFAETLRAMLPALSAALGGESAEDGEQGKSSTSPISGKAGSQASSA